jgi:hypothetical protein
MNSTIRGETMEAILRKKPFLLQFIDPVHQTADLVWTLTRKSPFVIEWVREDLRTPELVAACIAADPLCKNCLTPLRPDIYDEKPEPTDGQIIEHADGGISMGCSVSKWFIEMKKVDLKTLRQVLKQKPAFGEYLSQSAIFDMNRFADNI